MNIFDLIGKSAQWIVVVSVLWMFLFVRAANLLIWERFVSATVPAGLAFGLSEDLSFIFNGCVFDKVVAWSNHTTPTNGLFFSGGISVNTSPAIP